MTSEVTQADSGMDGQSVELAELVWANLPTNRSWASLPTYEKALVCHTLARLTAQSGEGRSGAGEDALREALAEHFPTGLRSGYARTAGGIPVQGGGIEVDCRCGWSTNATDEHEVREEWAAHVLAALRATDDAGGAAKAPDTGEGE